VNVVHFRHSLRVLLYRAQTSVMHENDDNEEEELRQKIWPLWLMRGGGGGGISKLQNI
jgi:hypothetical protein